MTSITKIILLITSIIANSGYALDVLGDDDIDQPSDLFEYKPSYSVEQDPAYQTRCDDISGCDKPEKSLDYPIDRDYYEYIGPKEPSDTKYAISKLPGLRERRQVLVKTKGSDDGPNSAIALLARSSSPFIRSMMRNRRSIPETTTRKIPEWRDGQWMYLNQRRLSQFMSFLTSPYRVLIPNINVFDAYVDRSKLYTS